MLSHCPKLFSVVKERANRERALFTESARLGDSGMESVAIQYQYAGYA